MIRCLVEVRGEGGAFVGEEWVRGGCGARGELGG